MTEQSQEVMEHAQGVIVQNGQRPLTPWEQATLGADYVASHDLAKEEDLDDLTGWEQPISSFVFRPGILRESKGSKKQFAYVST